LYVSILSRQGRAAAQAHFTPASPAERPIPGMWFAIVIGLSLFGLALMMAYAEVIFDFGEPANLPFVAGIAALAAARWHFRRPVSERARVARDMSEYFTCFMGISLIGATASYPVSAFTHGFADAQLQRADLALHFDWLAWYGFVAAHPLVQAVSRAAYATIYLSPAILLGYLAWAGRAREARDFLAAVWLAAAITLAAFRFMPAVGPFAYLWHGPIPYLPVSDLWQPQLIPQLRQHTAPPLDFGHLVGLVSAPSFHAAAAVLLIAFSLSLPTRLRGLLIALNVAMLLSTPVEGTHYLTDMILGAFVALGAIGLIRAVRSRFARAPAFGIATLIGVRA